MNVVFTEYFGLDRHFRNTFSSIVEDIWQYFLKDLVDQYLIRFYEMGECFEFGGIRFKSDGIEFIRSNKWLRWEEVRWSQYPTYFAVFKFNDSSAHHRLNFNEWGSEITFSLVRTIKEDKCEIEN